MYYFLLLLFCRIAPLKNFINAAKATKADIFPIQAAVPYTWRNNIFQ